MSRGLPDYSRGRWKYDLARKLSQAKKGREMNPELTLAHLTLLSEVDQEKVHENMVEGAYAEIRSRKEC